MVHSRNAGLFVLLLLAATEQAIGRTLWLERDNRAIFLYPRRFSQEHPAVLQKLSQACPGEVCGSLAGQAVTPLLAAQPECSQQDMADSIIDASKQFDAATQANMLEIAIEYRQAEKNTPPDFTTNPPKLRNSVFCQTAPRNAALNGLVQAQDPANDPNLFFDPATGATVEKGAQPNTFPFGTNSSTSSAEPTTAAPVSTSVSGTAGGAILVAEDPSTPCPTAITITVTGTNAAVATATNAVTINVGDNASSTTLAPTQAASTTSIAATATATAPSGTDFGSCTVPQINFGVGFDGRKETSFEPADKNSYNHGSAQNINIITQFMCDTLTNTCKANQAAKDVCATAKAAASAAAAGTGSQADAFNAAFGITTHFVDVPSVDNQGKIISGTGANNGTATTTELANTFVSAPTAVKISSAPAATSSSTASSGIGNFGKCTVPQIEFGVGFDGRKETSFEPVDKTSYNHGSAQNIAIITQFICDTLTNTCGADQTAKNTCATATSAAAAVTPGIGAQADAFNAVFGITTDFASVAQVDDQGHVVGTTSSTAAGATVITPPAATQLAQSTTTSIAAAESSSSTSGNLQTFTGALGGVTAPAVTASGNQFQVEGNSLFNDVQSAVGRSCDVQHNNCADAANASGNKGGFTVGACDTQQDQCKATA